ncbi:fimbrial biogenesis chaperone, partial [Serratia quinivorans]
MKSRLSTGIFLAISIWAGVAHAGIVVGGTRVVYNADKRETSLSISNPDKIPYLIQSWADADGPL